MKIQTCIKTGFLTGAVLLLLVAGCEEESTSSEVVAAPRGENGIVITSDYSTGSVSVVTTSTHAVQPNTRVIHSDSVCRYDDITGHIYVISRRGADVITVLNEDDGFKTMAQYSVEAGSNAQDIAVVSPSLAYVPRFDAPDMLLINPADGTVLARTNLAPYADADGIANAAQAVHRDGVVFVTVQRLDPMWSPTEYSSVLMIEAATGTIQTEVKLTGKNPTGILRYNAVVEAFVLMETGSYGVLEGGIETMKTDGTLSGLIVTEATLGGDVLDAIITRPDLGFAVISVPAGTGANTHLVTFNPQTGAKGQTLIISDGYNLSYMSLLDDSEVWVSDRTPTSPGVRIFDAKTAAEITTAPISVGLPPSMICFDK